MVISWLLSGNHRDGSSTSTSRWGQRELEPKKWLAKVAGVGRYQVSRHRRHTSFSDGRAVRVRATRRCVTPTALRRWGTARPHRPTDVSRTVTTTSGIVSAYTPRRPASRQTRRRPLRDHHPLRPHPSSFSPTLFSLLSLLCHSIQRWEGVVRSSLRISYSDQFSSTVRKYPGDGTSDVLCFTEDHFPYFTLLKILFLVLPTLLVSFRI